MTGIEHLFIDDGRTASRGRRFARGLLVFAFLAGLVAVAVYACHDTLEKSRWFPTPCTIRSCDVETDSRDPRHMDPYKLRVDYRYVFAGSRRGLWEHSSDDAAEIFRLKHEYPVGRVTTCFVNPASPSGWQPALFLLGTAALFCVCVPAYCVPEMLARPKPHVPRPEWKRRRGEWRSAILLFCGAAGVTVSLFGIAAARSALALRWPAVLCEVVSAGVVEEQAHQLPLYKSDVLYRYQYDGVEYHSNQYSHTDFPTPWYTGKRRLGRDMLRARNPVCYVNPRHPEEAVLTRAPSPSLCWVACGVAMAAIGLHGMVQNRPRLWRPIPGFHSGSVTGRLAYDWKPTAWLAGSALCGLLLAVAASDVYDDWREHATTTAGGITVVVLAVLFLFLVSRSARPVGRDARRAALSFSPLPR